MSDQSPVSGLPLSYVIDALAQLEEAFATQAREWTAADAASIRTGEGESEQRRHRAELRAAEQSKWVSSIAALEWLADRELEERLLRAPSPADEGEAPSARRLRVALVAGARLRVGAAPTVDLLHGA